MKIVVLGGDGFCGWPTALHLSDLAHDVLVADNLSRRRIDDELGTGSLTPIRPIEERVEVWRSLSGRALRFVNADACRYDALVDLLRAERPDAVVHFAEQRAAPYSMKSPAHKNYTVHNNVTATHNLLNALVETGGETHLVHLGTMGVYGYGHDEPVLLPDGYLDVRFDTADGREVADSVVYPPNPGSVYHLTKVLDAQMFQYYARNDRLRITDLHQGIVWGTQTGQTRRDERLINRFDYDGDYGTVLNRFLMQAAVGHPLTVHGTGGQTRAFIHVQDTCRCIERALTSPPPRGARPRIMNQMAEAHRLRDLAALVQRMTGCEIAYLPNPRNERARERPAGEQRRAARARLGAHRPPAGPPGGGHRHRPQVRRPVRPHPDPVHLLLDAGTGRGGRARRRSGISGGGRCCQRLGLASLVDDPVAASETELVAQRDVLGPPTGQVCRWEVRLLS